MIRKSAVEMAAALAKGETTSLALTQAHLDQIAAVDGAVHAFLHVDTEGALAQAGAIDKARAAGEKLSPLAGIPLALKDVLTQREYRPPADQRFLKVGGHRMTQPLSPI